MSSESLLWWNRMGAGRGVPDFLLERLNSARIQTRSFRGHEYVVVDARDPVYLDRLERFLAAVAEHFSGRRPVTLVDLRGFGLWGEWHSGYRYPTPGDRRAALVGIIDRYADAFRGHRLALCYSHDPDGPSSYYAGPNDRYDPAACQDYESFLHFSAFDHALSKTNITFRRDGAGGAVYSNQRRLNQEAFHRLRGPLMSEFVDGYHHVRQDGPGGIDFFMRDALSLHPNYVNVLGWQGREARNFLTEQTPWVGAALRSMGYRLLPVSIRHPSTITRKIPFRIETEWVNRAVGRVVRDYHLTLSLLTRSGRAVATCDTGPMDAPLLTRGHPRTIVREVMFDGIPPGAYLLSVGVMDLASRAPIRLPLKDPTGTVGPITVS